MDHHDQQRAASAADFLEPSTVGTESPVATEPTTLPASDQQTPIRSIRVTLLGLGHAQTHELLLSSSVLTSTPSAEPVAGPSTSVDQGSAGTVTLEQHLPAPGPSATGHAVSIDEEAESQVEEIKVVVSAAGKLVAKHRCRNCDKIYKSQAAAIHHVRNFHLTPAAQKKCRICRREFASARNLREHYATQHHWQCPYCGDVFQHSTQRQRHWDTPCPCRYEHAVEMGEVDAEDNNVLINYEDESQFPENARYTSRNDSDDVEDEN